VKPRVVRTQRLVLGVLVAVAGCSSTATPDTPGPIPGQPSDRAAAPVPTSTSLEPKSEHAEAAGTLAAPAVPADGSARRGDSDPQLVALREELDRCTEAEALARREHFRPLCDGDGYPLVGNLIRKGPGGYSPSAFCATVRQVRKSSS